MHIRPRRSLRLLSGALALALASLALATPASAHSTHDTNDVNGMNMSSGRGSIVDLAHAAIATAPFLSLDVAQKFGGYTAEVADLQGITCIAQPPDGAMGVHFLNPALADLSDDPNVTDTLDVTKPELLVYEPDGNGHFRLVALEYLILKKEWDATHSSPPSLFGQEFMTTLAGNRFGLPDFYSLHAWIWKFNPSGTFAMWNPNVHCPT